MKYYSHNSFAQISAILLVFAFSFCDQLFAATPANPAWDNYKVTQVPASFSAPIDMKIVDKECSWAKDYIASDTTEQPDFAGFFKILRVSAGTMCSAILLVDCRTGKIVQAPFSVEVGCSYKLESSLFIVNPIEQIREAFSESMIPDWLKTKYYSWNGKRFVPLKKKH
ncbi:MAG: hypothetical protein KKB51_05765 [Candidatus Riflebacteria bacterium]|nr:hypothetical protein [Candidatus Riflebacteria bacterium]